MLMQERLKELIEYDCDTGIFIWVKKSSVFSRIVIGSRAGYIDCYGYRSIKIDERQYREHRLAFLYVEGAFPIEDVDHINHIKTDNRFCNLRKASEFQNMGNKITCHKNNKSSKLLGVSKYTGYSNFVARIHANGTTYNLGTFLTAEAAHTAYLEAKRKLHEFNTL